MCGKVCLRVLEFLHLRTKHAKIGIRPETFLTPYEMEMVPSLLKEVLTNNSNFFEIVCYRWYNESIQDNMGSTLDGHLGMKCDQFEKEGYYLKSLVFKLARCLADKGTFDDDCEKRLTLYRQKRQHRAFNESLLKMTNDDVKSCKTSNLKYRNNFSVSDDNFVEIGIKDKRRRFSSNRSTSMAISPSSPLDLLFIQMGEVLIRQFQASISEKEGHVDDREMKTLIWKHFVQMLIVVLTDNYRYS